MPSEPPPLRRVVPRARRSRGRRDLGPSPTAPPSGRPDQSVPLVRWAGRLIVAYGTAHTLGALTAEGAGRHAGTWVSGRLWREGLSDMSPAMSAYWLSVNSFGPPLVLLGLTVLEADRRGAPPPPLLAWSLAGWTALGFVVTGPGVGQDLVLLVAAGLLVAGARQTADRPRRTRRPHPAGRLQGVRPA